MQKCFNYVRKNLKRKEGTQGITLIALVITVIILLILAGTAITLGIDGENLFRKTNEAANEWNMAVAKEESALSNVFEILDMAANPDLAKYKLTVKVDHDGNGNETTVESPYYVWYPSAKFIDESSDENCKGIKCRVLYNDSTYGLQIISVNPVTTVTLGKNDPNSNVTGEMESVERAQNSYNRLVTTLNEKAEEYIAIADGSILATDARCVGSDPLNKNYPDNTSGSSRESEMFTSTLTNMADYSGKYFKQNYRYQIDGMRLRSIGAATFNIEAGEIRYYLLAARRVNEKSGLFSIYYGTSNGLGNTSVSLWKVDSEGLATATKFSEMGFRPVFTLSPEVKIIGGLGTEESPFELGL